MGLLDLLFLDKKICLFCKGSKKLKFEFICQDCFSNLSFKEDSYFLEGYEYVYSVLEYDRYLKPHIYKYKYCKASYYSKIFSKLMVYGLDLRGKMRKIDLIVPVPLHWRRESFRGYNQSLLLAESIGKYYKIPVENKLLIRRKRTNFQNKLGKRERQENLAKAFRLLGAQGLENKNILVVDDIYTTGSTLYYCGQELRKIPNIKLYGLTLATGKA